ncbi:MAG: endonuclease/exonuclease/phosphatase family protein [Actinomycetales bacterium]|nr:endonuclease/exonuclease/phosphatase family protein [Candidatus Phosphoribacter baldrii]
MRIATWNVNSIRSRIDRVEAWLARSDVDVLAIQETKAKADQFPMERLQACGYEVAHHGFNQWNGVAILSRVGLTEPRANGRPSMPSSRPGSPTSCARTRLARASTPIGTTSNCASPRSRGCGSTSSSVRPRSRRASRGGHRPRRAQGHRRVRPRARWWSNSPIETGGIPSRYAARSTEPA